MRNNISRLLINDIDNTQILKQEDLNLYFAKARYNLEDCLLEIASVCAYLQHCFLDQAVSVIAAIDKNRSIYKKTNIHGEHDRSATNRETQNKRLMCHGMDMAAALIENDVEKQQSILIESNLIRAVYEQFIEKWLLYLEGTEVYCFGSDASYLRSSIEKRTQYELAIQGVEKKVKATKPEFLFGCLRFVKKRFNAIKRLYAKILEAYTRIVLQIAKITAGSIAQEHDSYQNGALGLMRAISSYDHCSEMSFPNYARLWIKQNILLSLKTDANVIKIPLNIWQQSSELERAHVKLEAKYGVLSHEEAASKLGLPRNYVKGILHAIKATNISSLDSLLSLGEETSPTSSISLNQILEDESYTKIEQVLHSQVKVGSIFHKLSYNQQLVTCLVTGMLESMPEKKFTEEEKNDCFTSEVLRQTQTH